MKQKYADEEAHYYSQSLTRLELIPAYLWAGAYVLS